MDGIHDAMRPQWCSRSAATLAVLLAAALFLNVSLFAAIVPPLMAYLCVKSMVGTWAALAAALLVLDGGTVWAAIRATPWAPTPEHDLDDLLHFAAATMQLSSSTFLELGSGDGRNLIRAIRHGFSSAVGLEWNPALVAVSCLRALFDSAGRTTTTHADILKEPLPQIVEGGLVVYLYMSREVLQRLGPRLACAYGGREQTLVLTRDFEIPGWSEPRRLQRGRTTLLAYAAGNAPACLTGRHMGDTWGNTRLT